MREQIIPKGQTSEDHPSWPVALDHALPEAIAMVKAELITSNTPARTFSPAPAPTTSNPTAPGSNPDISIETPARGRDTR